MARPRLVATDLDGTLLTSAGTVSDRSHRALETARRTGLDVVVTTGRPPRAITQGIRDAIGHAGVVICANGALLYDLDSGSVVAENSMAPDAALMIVRHLRAQYAELSFAVETAGGFGHEPEFIPLLPSRSARVANVEELVGEPIAKLLALHPEMGPDQLVADVRELIGDLAEVTHSSRRGLAEISAVGVSKAFALEALARDRGVSGDEVVAFGDMPNDIPMLAWSGHGVGVANAHPEVLAIVDEVTLSNDEDGVAVVLERLASVV